MCDPKTQVMFVNTVLLIYWGNRFILQSNNIKGLLRATENFLFLNISWLITPITCLCLCDRLRATDPKSLNNCTKNVIQGFVE